MSGDDIWYVNDMEGSGTAHECERCACRRAEGIVGNKAVARAAGGEIRLYGPGDGTTRVMVRELPRAWVTEEVQPCAC